MDNIELERKIKEIIDIDNYFDMSIAIKNFEKEYKKTSFFKETRKPLKEVINEARIHYLISIESARDKLQSLINGLSMDHLMQLFDQIGDTFAKENQDIGEMINTLKELR